MSKKKEEVITLCAILYKEERERASETKFYVPDGTLKRIVTQEVEKTGLELIQLV
jgi:hypothetical protein